MLFVLAILGHINEGNADGEQGRKASKMWIPSKFGLRVEGWGCAIAARSRMLLSLTKPSETHTPGHPDLTSQTKAEPVEES